MVLPHYNKAQYAFLYHSMYVAMYYSTLQCTIVNYNKLEEVHSVDRTCIAKASQMTNRVVYPPEGSFYLVVSQNKGTPI